MTIYNRNEYISQLEELLNQEKELERYLYENRETLDTKELSDAESKLIAIRYLKQELDEIITGAYF